MLESLRSTARVWISTTLPDCPASGKPRLTSFHWRPPLVLLWSPCRDVDRYTVSGSFSSMTTDKGTEPGYGKVSHELPPLLLFQSPSLRPTYNVSGFVGCTASAKDSSSLSPTTSDRQERPPSS